SEIRKRPFVIGAAWWTYNDYQSRYYNTNPNGYRPWGLVRPDRSRRPAYTVYQQEMAPVIVEKVHYQVGKQGVHQLKLKVTARGDFPAYPVRGYILKAPHIQLTLPDLQPGESAEVSLPVNGFLDELQLAIFKSTGYLALEQTVRLNEQN